jgi:tryptophan synthase alpha chain
MIPDRRASRIARAFGKRDVPLLVTCTVAGDPDYDESRVVIRTLADAGADIIELVMPFSDPVADGPVIQEAGARALAAGMTTDRLFVLVRDVRRETGIPLLIMTYANIIVQRGIETFYRQAARAGADGVVVADVPLEEAGPYCEAAREVGIEPVLFISQTTSPERMERILASAGGFIYLVAAMGVTGVRNEIEPGTISLLRLVKEKSPLPVVPGFGISSPDQVRAYARAGADGVIVGSAIVRLVGEYAGRKEGMEEAIGRLIRDLKAATREHGSMSDLSVSRRKDSKNPPESCT